MKELEDRGWEAMSKLLDTSLPQKKRYFIKLWELLTLVGLTGIVILLLNWNSIKYHINSGDKTGTSAALIQNKSVQEEAFTENNEGPEPGLAEIKNEPIENKLINSPEEEKGEKTYTGATDLKTNYNTNSIKSIDGKNDNLNDIKVVSTSNVTNVPDVDKSGQITKSHVIQSPATKADTKDESTTESGETLLSESQVIQRSDLSSVSLLPALMTGNLHINNLTFQSSIKIRNKKIRPVAFYIKGGAFMANNVAYSGFLIAPELTYKIGKRSDLFVNVQARYKKTQEEIIYNEFAYNAQNYIDSSLGTTVSSTEIPSPDKVNVNTFDLGIDLGYRISVLNRLSVGVYGFYRYNNLFNQVPVSEQSLLLLDQYNQTDFEAFKSVSSTITTYKQIYNYGAGLDLNFRIGSRSVLYGNFNRSLNGKKNYEITLGYGFRLF